MDSHDSEKFWQRHKPALECHRNMFDKQIATDIHFELDTPDGSTRIIGAHKYMLIARSPVFEAMLTGGLAESRLDFGAVIKIRDADVETFQMTLRYMYCDDCDSFTEQNVVPVIYLANQYLLSGLITKCVEFIDALLNPDNVCEFLDLGCDLHETEIVDKCLFFISHNTLVVTSSRSFLELSHEALVKIVELQQLQIPSEGDLFNACVEWAKFKFRQHLPDDLTPPSGVQIRDILGDIMTKIRFPMMTPEAFAECAERHQDILNAKEKSDIGRYFVDAQTPDGMDDRLLTARIPFILQRFDICHVIEIETRAMPGEIIRFSTSAATRLLALGILGRREGPLPFVQMAVQLCVPGSDFPINRIENFKLTRLFGSCAESDVRTAIIKLIFDRPIDIKPHVECVIYLIAGTSRPSLCHKIDHSRLSATFPCGTVSFHKPIEDPAIIAQLFFI